jgi:DNA-binding GntR family transcriptional regulator
MPMTTGVRVTTSTAGPVRPVHIYEELRERILSQAAQPGSTFTESAVALEFGVARPTAKMAIERLVAEGLLRREKNQAARVPVLTRADVIDLLDARAVVESAAVSRLAFAGTIPAEALAAHRAIQSLDEAAPPLGSPGIAALDIAFHRALVTGQGNVRLQRMHSLIMGEIELCIGQVLAGRLRTAADVVSDHQQILDAVTAGDSARAETLSERHISVTRTRLLTQFDELAR